MWREVRTTLSRFIAIFAISALGAGFYAGLKATGPDMKATGDLYYEEQRLMDARLLCTMGFTDADVAALRQLDFIGNVMATYGLDLLVEIPGGTAAARVMALPENHSEGNPDYLNRPVLLEGRLPQTPDECVVDEEYESAVGDLVRLSEENDPDSLDMMATRQFRVVGRVQSPLYVSFQRGNTNIGNGRLQLFFYTTAAAFDSEFYTELFVTWAGTENLSSFSQAYMHHTEANETALATFASQREQTRFNDIHQEAEAELADARRELEEGRTEAETQLADAWQEIEDARAKIAEGWAEVRSGEADLADAERELAEGEAALADARAKLEAGEAEYTTQAAAFNSAWAEYEANAAMAARLAAYLAAAPGHWAVVQQLHPEVIKTNPDPGDVTAFEAAAAALLAPLPEAESFLRQAGQDDFANMLLGVRQQAEAALAAKQYNALYLLLNGLWSPLPQPEFGGLNPMELLGAGLSQAQAQLAAALPQLENGRALLSAARSELDTGWADYNAGLARMEQGRRDLAQARQDLAQARQELADAEAELADGIAEYETERAKAYAELDDAQAEIDDAQRQLDELDAPEWFVFLRADNAGYSGFASDTERIDAIAIVIPVFFFLVATLVCLTTMTRMVEEQRTFIGTLKALGFSKPSIALQYLLYGGMASASGAVAGVALGSYIFPTTIWNAYGIMYQISPLHMATQIPLAVGSVAACVLCTLLATFASCYNELRSVPAALMRPKAPKPGKRVFLERIPPLWRRMSFNYKVTARNLLRYKKRFLMTVIGVAGCTALLLTGFGLRDSITGIVGIQFGELYQYDMAAMLENPSDAGADTPLNAALPSLGEGLYTVQTVVAAETDQGSSGDMTTYLYVAQDPARLPEFITMRDRHSGRAIPFPQDGGALITEKLATRLDVGAGGSILVTRPGEHPVAVPVAGVVENYVMNYIYLAPESFTELFGETPAYNTLLLRLPANGTAEEEQVLETLLDTPGVAGAGSIHAERETMDNMLSSLNAVVGVVILAAAMLAFVVLYNLTNINITERKREIATLKVLGFHNGEVAGYVYRENVILTLIGIAVGLGLGIFLHQFVITTAEIDEVMFRRTVEPLSYLWSVLFTLVTGGLVNLVMLRRLRNIDMVESLKSSE